MEFSQSRLKRYVIMEVSQRTDGRWLGLEYRYEWQGTAGHGRVDLSTAFTLSVILLWRIVFLPSQFIGKYEEANKKISLSFLLFHLFFLILSSFIHLLCKRKDFCRVNHQSNMVICSQRFSTYKWSSNKQGQVG